VDGNLAAVCDQELRAQFLLHFSQIFLNEYQNNGSYLRARNMLLIVIPYLSPGTDRDFSHILIKKSNDDLAKYMSDFAQITPPSVFRLCTKVF
jgi:hypothetical protein